MEINFPNYIASIDKNLLIIVSYVIPGLIIYYIRAQFITVQMAKHTEAMLTYFVFSLVYYVFYFTTVFFLNNIILPISNQFFHLDSLFINFIQFLGWVCRIFIGPVMVGIVLGVLAQKDTIRFIAKRFGLSPLYPIHTAWEYKFKDMKPSFVIVTLKDGTICKGYCGQDSFISDTVSERDIYIENYIDSNDEAGNNFLQKTPHGLYIAAGEIKMIQILPSGEIGASDITN